MKIVLFWSIIDILSAFEKDCFNYIRELNIFSCIVNELFQ
jgi:hypothetical protein